MALQTYQSIREQLVTLSVEIDVRIVIIHIMPHIR
jgi:hypothetical protein